jgi:hypothetical protein
VEVRAKFPHRLPPDAAAPYFDSAFCNHLGHANLDRSQRKHNRSRFVLAGIRLWDRAPTNHDSPRVAGGRFQALTLGHGNGLELKGHTG